MILIRFIILQMNIRSCTYYGIGAALKQDPDTKQVTVSKVYSGTPSEEAGLKKDDEIVSVDGVKATSEDLTKLVSKIRGEEGTKVTLEIRRGEDTDPFTVEVERKNVELPSVDSRLLDNGVEFADQGYANLYAALKTMQETYTPLAEVRFTDYYPKVHTLYDGLRQMQQELPPRAAAGEDVETLAEETWALFRSIQ